MDNTVRWMNRVGDQQVFRARFSAISAPEIRQAMNRLVEPNRAEALAVDARQELDLKVSWVRCLLSKWRCLMTSPGGGGCGA